MPQLMPLNWMMSIFMFLIILTSICWVFSMKKEFKSNYLGNEFNNNFNKWPW